MREKNEPLKRMKKEKMKMKRKKSLETAWI